MALHEYECTKCGFVFETLASKGRSTDKEPGPLECPKCGSSEVRKLVSKIQMLKDFFCKPSG